MKISYSWFTSEIQKILLVIKARFLSFITYFVCDLVKQTHDQLDKKMFPLTFSKVQKLDKLDYFPRHRILIYEL